MKLVPTPRFKKAYSKLSDQIRKRVDESLRVFMTDPRHPSLHFEKLKGSSYKTIRADRGRWRIVLRGSGAEFELIDVDRHEKVDRNFG